MNNFLLKLTSCDNDRCMVIWRNTYNEEYSIFVILENSLHNFYDVSADYVIRKIAGFVEDEENIIIERGTHDA